MEYAYDGEARLFKFFDRAHSEAEDAWTEFTYENEEFPTHLTGVEQHVPSGTTTPPPFVRSDYDDIGRLTQICQVAGATERCVDVTMDETDLGDHVQTIIGRNGLPTVLHYDAQGRVTLKEDALGHPWETPEYTDDDQPLLEIDPLGNEAHTAYTDEGHVSSVTRDVEHGETTESTCFTWSEDGELLGTEQGCDPENPGEPDSRYTYDSDGNLLTDRDALDHGSTITVDGSGNPESIADALGHVTQQVWSGGLLREETDASGVRTVHDYISNYDDDPEDWVDDPNGNAWSVTRYSAEGDFLGETLREFDEDGHPTRSLGADGSISETVYDGAGRRWKQRELVGLGADPNDPEDDVYRVTETYFDEYGQVRWTRYADDTYTEVLRDDSGNEIWRRSRTRYTSWHATNGPVRDQTDLSIVTQTAFDGLDRPVKTCVGDGANLLNPPDEWALGCTWTEYDPAGRVKWSRDERGAVRITDFDGMGRAIVSCGPFFPEETLELDDDLACADVEDLPVATTHHDEQGRVDWTQDELGVYAVTLFDAAGRRRAECSTNDLELVPENPNPPLETGDPDNDIACSTFEMDAAGRVIAQEDRNGTRTEYGFDELGRLIAVTDALGQVTSYAFDDSGNMTEQHDAKERVTHFDFDDMGRRTARVLPLSQRETFAHGISGAMASRVDFMGRTTTQVTDPETGRVTSVDFANDPTVTTTYFSDGQRATVAIADGETVTYHRDEERGLLSRVDHSEGTDIAYSRDRAGNRNAITTDPGGSTERTITYDHDAAGRVARVWDGFKRAEPLDEEETPVSGQYSDPTRIAPVAAAGTRAARSASATSMSRFHRVRHHQRPLGARRWPRDKAPPQQTPAPACRAAPEVRPRGARTGGASRRPAGSRRPRPAPGPALPGRAARPSPGSDAS